MIKAICLNGPTQEMGLPRPTLAHHSHVTETPLPTPAHPTMSHTSGTSVPQMNSLDLVTLEHGQLSAIPTGV